MNTNKVDIIAKLKEDGYELPTTITPDLVRQVSQLLQQGETGKERITIWETIQDLLMGVERTVGETFEFIFSCPNISRDA